MKREVREETQLHADIERLLLDEPDLSEGSYQRVKTYVCRIKSGEPRPGVDTPEKTTIIQVGWFDLRAPTTWDLLARNIDRSESRHKNEK